MFTKRPVLLVCKLVFIFSALSLKAADAGNDLTYPNVQTDIEAFRQKPAADIDGHVIPMEDVIFACLRLDRTYVIDQTIQSYVLHRECLKQGVVISEADIDKQVAQLRTNLAPATLEDTLKEHHTTMQDARDSFRRQMEETNFVANQVKPMKMLHCRQIVIGFGSAGGSSTTNRTKTEALALANDIRTQLKPGADFDKLAARYSEDSSGKGDLGIIYENMMELIKAPVLQAALTLHKGEFSAPVETDNAYHILHAVSSGDDHPQAENALYEAADKTSRAIQIRFLGPTAVVGLINKSTITHMKDSELIHGKPLPEAAATVDGHVVPLKDVLIKALASTGRKRLDILIQNYVVDRECERQKIVVSETEIDERVATLRKQIAPITLDDGLAQHHTTLEGLRHDFRQEIERTKLVLNEVPATRSAHARVIFVHLDPSAPAADAEARDLITDIQKQLKAGRSFTELASQYASAGDLNRDGDIGILYEGKRAVDTALVKTALALGKDEISPDPIKTYDGYFLLQVISTGDSHPVEENAAYDQAMATYRQERAQSHVPHSILDLIKNSKITYHL